MDYQSEYSLEINLISIKDYEVDFGMLGDEKIGHDI
jgi:hypothetical protein